MIIVIKNRGITLIHFLFANSRNRRQTKRGNTKKGNHDKVTGGSSKKRKKKDREWMAVVHMGTT